MTSVPRDAPRRWSTSLGLTQGPSLILTLCLCAFACASSGELALTPRPVENDEQSILDAAKHSKAKELDREYRQFDLVIARVATWEGARDLGMRLWLPLGEMDQPRPVVAYVHGGAFISGDHAIDMQSERDAFARMLRAALDAGFAVASLDYRLCREAGWPAPVRDTLCGLRFLAAHGRHWGIDGERIGVCGHSAGARIASLLSMVRHDPYHTGELPWRKAQPTISATWLWAGSAWQTVNVEQWTAFGKPKAYSVERMLFGEHPAVDQMTRHRLRLRSNLPHLSMAMSPVYLLRGRDDYGGDHDDAERVVRIWQGLGIEAEMRIVSGGHSATGPAETFVAYFRKHLGKGSLEAAEANPIETARRLLQLGEPVAAIEVLTSSSGPHDPKKTAGGWITLSNGQVLWVADDVTYPKVSRQLLVQAQQRLAEGESSIARQRLSVGDWSGARTAAAAAVLLVGNQDMVELRQQIATAIDRESRVFKALALANHKLHAGEREAAIAVLAGDDQRLVAARRRLGEQSNVARPSWASKAGTDVYGKWADLALAPGTHIRMRWVDPGTWVLPPSLRYRNRRDDPWTGSVKVAHGYWLSESEVTTGQWHPGKGQSADDRSPALHLPITGIDYLQIVAWLERLQSKHQGVVFRLPSEQHWLHAATQGGRTDVRGDLGEHAVHALLAGEKPGLRPVNSTVPDLGGFYGFIGGVQEWTSSPGRNPARFQGADGKFHVWGYPIARGGSWASMPSCLGPAIRQQQRHTNRQGDLGFRLMISDKQDTSWLRELEIAR